MTENTPPDAQNGPETAPDDVEQVVDGPDADEGGEPQETPQDVDVEEVADVDDDDASDDTADADGATDDDPEVDENVTDADLEEVDEVEVSD